MNNGRTKKGKGMRCCVGRVRGFSLLELVMALVVSAIVLGAVSTLAYALMNANDGLEDKALKQSYVRAATLRIAELIKYSKVICGIDAYGIAIWRSDDNGDGKINLQELVYIGSDVGWTKVQVVEFYDDNREVPLNGIRSFTDWPGYGCITYRVVEWMPQCQNVQITVDGSPPWSKSVTIMFDMVENGVMTHYEINASLRAWAGHLLDASGILLLPDDDEFFY